MKTKSDKRGLTLIELMVTALAAAILVISVGAILFLAFRSWRINSAFADLRRDSAFAFAMMTRDVRESSYDDLATAPDSLILTRRDPDDITQKITVTYTQTAGDALEYDNGTDTIQLIPEGVVEFFDADTLGGAGDGVLLTLELRTDDEYEIPLRNEVFVNTRN